MRALALDIGEKRVGVAVSDAAGAIASPVCVLAFDEVYAQVRAWRRILQDWQPDVLVCGLPLTLAGEEGPQAQRIRAVAQHIADACNLALEFSDERLSSTEAKRTLRDLGYDEAEMRGKIDMIAASLFLQSWLDAQHTHPER